MYEGVLIINFVESGSGSLDGLHKTIGKDLMKDLVIVGTNLFDWIASLNTNLLEVGSSTCTSLMKNNRDHGKDPKEVRQRSIVKRFLGFVRGQSPWFWGTWF